MNCPIQSPSAVVAWTCGWKAPSRTRTHSITGTTMSSAPRSADHLRHVVRLARRGSGATAFFRSGPDCSPMSINDTPHLTVQPSDADGGQGSSHLRARIGIDGPTRAAKPPRLLPPWPGLLRLGLLRLGLLRLGLLRLGLLRLGVHHTCGGCQS